MSPQPNIGGMLAGPTIEMPGPLDLQKTATNSSLNLAKTGSTGLGEEMDAKVGALAKNQAITAQGGTIQDIIADIQQEQIPQLRAERLALVKAANEDRDLTPEETLASMILQIAPIIIGASFGGKAGAGIGAAAGTQGGVTLMQGIQADNAKSSKAKIAEAEILAGQEKQLASQAAGLQKMGLQQSFQSGENAKNRAASIQAAEVGGRGMTALAKSIAVQEQQRLVPVPPQLKELLGETATAASVQAGVERLLQEKKLSKPVSDAVAKHIAELDTIEGELNNLKTSWEDLTKTSAKSRVTQGVQAAVRELSTKIPFVATDAKKYEDKKKVIARAFGKSIESDKYSNEDAAFWENRLAAAGESYEQGIAKLDSALSIAKTMKQAQIIAQGRNSRDITRFVSSSPSTLEALPDKIAEAQDGELVAYLDKAGGVKVIQVFKADGQVINLEPINFTKGVK